MKKLAFEGATNFMMPKMEVVGLEKESNIVFSTKVSVYEPASNGTGFTYDQMRALARGEEVTLAEHGVSTL